MIYLALNISILGKHSTERNYFLKVIQSFHSHRIRPMLNVDLERSLLTTAFAWNRAISLTFSFGTN